MLKNDGYDASPISRLIKKSICNAGYLDSIPESGRSAEEGIGYTPVYLGFPDGSAGKESACNAGDLDWEDPLEKGKTTHSQYSGLENSMDCIYSPWGRKESDMTE